MAATVKDETIARSMMFLFLGASAVLVAVQWRAWAVNSGNQPPDETTHQEVAAAKPSLQQTKSLKANRTQAKSVNAQAKPTSPELKAPELEANVVQAMKKLAASDQIASVQVSSDQSQAVLEGFHLVVNLSDRRVYVYDGKQLEVSYPLAVGQEGWETPTGSFNVIELQKNPKWLHPITREVVPRGPSNPLGERWIGFWADEKTHIGFHGTNQEDLIGQAVSHGCLRMRNRDVIALYDKVSEGTPVIVRK
jgi:lipoprotein-anchoring transpeptidase ErfK/SrfK